MKSHLDPDFREHFGKLPRHVQRQARNAYRRFVQNPSHPGLQFKKIDAEASIYSIRIGIQYRALGRRVGDEITWFWIGSHSDYDKLIG